MSEQTKETGVTIKAKHRSGGRRAIELDGPGLSAVSGGSEHGSVLNVGLCDGSVRAYGDGSVSFVSDTIDPVQRG
jgi:prepilin-type processing-associated H-X9-DG protein